MTYFDHYDEPGFKPQGGMVMPLADCTVLRKRSGKQKVVLSGASGEVADVQYHPANINVFEQLVEWHDTLIVVPSNDPVCRDIRVRIPTKCGGVAVSLDDIPSNLRAFYKLKYG